MRRALASIGRQLGTLGLLAVGAAGTPFPLLGQLRPLDPLDWTAIDGDPGASLGVGFGFYVGQRASLAGTRGRLMELGVLHGTWTVGRAAFQLNGAAVRVFRDQSVFAEPVGGTRLGDGGRRVDAGEPRVSTIVRLTEEGGPWDGALRFGVRLPTTDDREGLERDRTDFFVTVAGRRSAGPLTATAELGMGVLGTRDTRNEQVDPLLFALGVSWNALGWLRPGLVAVGQHDTRRGPEMRGNEDLGEVRLSVSGGEDHWVQVALVRGWTPFSPDWGVTVQTGLRH
ncbi:MAG: hypothetical protein PVI57_19855 [Gemmatimonadota bacterium]